VRRQWSIEIRVIRLKGLLGAGSHVASFTENKTGYLLRRSSQIADRVHYSKKHSKRERLRVPSFQLANVCSFGHSIICIVAYGLFLPMYLRISTMFRTLICAVFSTTNNKLSMYILLSSNYRQSAGIGCLISSRLYPSSVDGQTFASTTATANDSAGNVTRLLWWCQESTRTMTVKGFSIARRARH
jgi:hypothetical protein